MKIHFGKGSTDYGPGVQIDLTGEEVATAIDAYLTARNIHTSGPRTINVNGKLCKNRNLFDMKDATKPNSLISAEFSGLTKREHFACVAMQSFLGNNNIDLKRSDALEVIAKSSVKIANELIMQLNLDNYGN